MAKQLKEVQWNRYPWDEWTNGKPWEARQGKDFDVDIRSFRSVLHMRARDRGMTVRTKAEGDKVIFQFFQAD